MVKKLVFTGLLLVLILALLALPVRTLASPQAHIVMGGSYTLEKDETLDEDLTILGGNATLEAGSLVNGDVVLLGGRLEVYGRVDGSLTAAAGVLKLGDEAYIEGDVTVAGAVLERDSGAQIEGDLITDSDTPFGARFDGLWRPVQWWLESVWNVFWFIGLAFALAALAVLLLMFFEKPTLTAARTVVAQPAISGGLGCLTIVVAPFLLLLLVISICLIPVALVVVLLLGVVITFGWVILGYEVGSRLAQLAGQDWAAPIEAGLGTFLLVMVGGLLNILPPIGWTYLAAVSAIGMGAVLLTRFGTQDYAAQPTLRFGAGPAPKGPELPPSAAEPPKDDEPPAQVSP